MKLWAMKQAGLITDYAFDTGSSRGSIRGVRVPLLGIVRRRSERRWRHLSWAAAASPRIDNLQPEPALGQVLGLSNVRGYEFDVQITTAPVTDGSLSSCPPAEAVTWGKVDKDTYMQSTESSPPADYSMVMPFVVTKP